MFVYTRARRYELMTWLVAEHKYGSFSPQRVFLEPSQRVEAVDFPDWPSIKNVNPQDVSALIPIRVTVKGVAIQGWLPKYSLTENYLRQHTGHVVDLHGDKETIYPITFTGVKYGAYSKQHPVNDLSKDAPDTGTAPPVAALWQSATLCNHCAKPRSDHKIQETEEVAADCELLHSLIIELARRNRVEVRAMIGVLHVVDTQTSTRRGYVALASPTHLYQTAKAKDIKPPLQTQIDACEELARRKGFTFVSRLKTPFKNCSGAEAAVQADPLKTSCAAPKLLSQGIFDCFPNGLSVPHRESIRIFLSEKWCRTPGYSDGPDLTAHSDGHTIDSCNKCRDFVRHMLCFYENPYKKALVGRA